MMPMNWTLEQLSAINKDGNIIVSAGAGSGKTAVLSERVIRKIKDGSHINELLILTFTEAAAQEMKDRIRKKLIKNNLKDELLYLDSSFITTFDSYALSIVKKYYYLLNINPDIKIITNLDIEKKRIIDEIFERSYENNDLFKSMIDDLCVKDDENMKQSILSLGDKISLNIDYDKYLNEYIDKTYNDSIIDKHINEYINIIKREINKIEDSLHNLSLCDDNDYYNTLYDLFLPLINSKNYEDIVSNLNIVIPSVPRGSEEDIKYNKERINEYYKNIKSLIKYDNLNSYKEEVLKTKNYSIVVIDLLKEYFEELKKYKQYINRYEFNDIAHMAIKVVENNKNVKEETKSSFNEIMIDEYQDTNDIQEYFISLISNNNVYMVGDIKQSIYRFRNANPGIFKDKYELYKNNKDGIKIDLNKNFRSRDIVLNDINNIFNNLMDINYGSANYKDEHQLVFGNNMFNTKQDNQDYDLEILKYKDNNYSKEEQEIFIIADDIINKVKNKYKVLKDNELVDCSYEDFAILIDRSTSFDLIKKIFEYKKIPLSILKDESINDSDEIYLFKNLLTVLLKYNKQEYDIEFKYSLVSILRGYLVGLSDNQIFEIVSKNDYLNNIVIDKIKNIKITSINKILDDIVKEFDIFSKLVNVGNISKRSSLINYIIDLGKEKSSIGYDIEMYLHYLNDLVEIKPDIRYNVDNNQNGVKLMTIYKSKGLEFPICYMPMLYKKFNISDLKDIILYDNDLGIICPYYEDGIKTMFYKDILKDKYIKEEISEKIRLFYVALTRSKEKLILIHYDDEKDKTLTIDENRSFKDFIDYLKPYLKFKDVESNVDTNYNKVIDIKSLDIKLESNKLNEISISKKEIIKDNYSSSSKELITKEEYDNMQYGIKLHKELEEFNLNSEIVKKFINHEELKDILNSEMYHEYEFIYNGNIGIIDLLLEYNDKYIIVDFKTNEIEKEEYYNQVNKYKEYIEFITNKQVKGYLYSIKQDKLKEVV